MRVDIFFDWTFAAAEEIQRLFKQTLDREGPLVFGCSMTFVLPENVAPPVSEHRWRFAQPSTAATAAACAVETAGAAERHLLFVLGGFVPTLETVGGLLACLDHDPMFGFAIPRVSTDDGSGIEALTFEGGDRENSFLPRRAICDLPEVYIVPELVAPCVLVRGALVANLAMTRGEFRSVAGALSHYFGKGRRIGYRGVVANRVVVTCGQKRSRAESPDPVDYWKLLRLLPDFNRARAVLDGISAYPHEALLARAHNRNTDFRKSLILDATAMGACFNGTSECNLALADALHSLNHDWKVVLAARDDARAFHRLEGRFPNWDIVSDITLRQATVAFKLSQPWAFNTLRDLHRSALLNFYLILDTIAWDILWSTLAPLDDLWRFSAQYSDGLFYISDFTGQRFRTRFPIGAGVREKTLRLSCHPHDYVRRDAFGKPVDPQRYWLVVGNPYDHKDLIGTVEMLARCFPYERIHVLGLEHSEYPNVSVVASGSVSEPEMASLYANALAVIFPSYYEGFGFPVIRGLSYGKAVIARKSELLNELAAHYRGDGQLFAVSTHRELAEIVARLIDGEPIPSRPLGDAVAPGAEPESWKTIATNMLNFFENCMVDPGQGLWLAREQAFRQMAAYKA